MRFSSPPLMVAISIVSLAIANGASDLMTVMDRPVMGYVAYTSPPELRALLGVPGAAVFSDPLPLPGNVRRVHLPPGQQYAVLDRVDAGPAILLLNGARTGQLVPIPEAVPSSDIIAFSPRARSAVILAEAAGMLQVITGLPESPDIVLVLDTGLLPECPQALAISDNGRNILVSSSHAVYQLHPDGTATVVANVSGVAALTYLPESPNAAIADRSTGSVYSLDSRGPSPTATLLVAGLVDLGDITPDDSKGTLYITNPSRNSIWSIQLLNAEVGISELPVSPSRIDRLRDPDALLVALNPGEPAWIFLRKENLARTVFVPARSRFRVERPIVPDHSGMRKYRTRP